MDQTERSRLVAPCGIDCGICELYLSRHNAELKTLLIGMGIPADALPCEGCRENQGHCPLLGKACATWTCAADHGVTFCGECPEFPCAKLNPAADRGDRLPHNLKAFNLSLIRARGMDAFLAQSEEIKKRYFKGKMVIGAGPQLP